MLNQNQKLIKSIWCQFVKIIIQLIHIKFQILLNYFINIFTLNHFIRTMATSACTIYSLFISSIISIVLGIATLILAIIFQYIGFVTSSFSISLCIDPYLFLKYTFQSYFLMISFIGILVGVLMNIIVLILVILTVKQLRNTLNSQNPQKQQSLKFSDLILSKSRYAAIYALTALGTLGNIVCFGFYLTFKIDSIKDVSTCTFNYNDTNLIILVVISGVWLLTYILMQGFQLQLKSHYTQQEQQQSTKNKYRQMVNVTQQPQDNNAFVRPNNSQNKNDTVNYNQFVSDLNNKKSIASRINNQRTAMQKSNYQNNDNQFDNNRTNNNSSGDKYGIRGIPNNGADDRYNNGINDINRNNNFANQKSSNYNDRQTGSNDKYNNNDRYGGNNDRHGASNNDKYSGSNDKYGTSNNKYGASNDYKGQTQNNLQSSNSNPVYGQKKKYQVNISKQRPNNISLSNNSNNQQNPFFQNQSQTPYKKSLNQQSYIPKPQQKQTYKQYKQRQIQLALSNQSNPQINNHSSHSNNKYDQQNDTPAIRIGSLSNKIYTASNLNNKNNFNSENQINNSRFKGNNGTPIRDINSRMSGSRYAQQESQNPAKQFERSPNRSPPQRTYNNSILNNQPIKQPGQISRASYRDQNQDTRGQLVFYKRAIQQNQRNQNEKYNKYESGQVSFKSPSKFDTKFAEQEKNYYNNNNFNSILPNNSIKQRSPESRKRGFDEGYGQSSSPEGSRSRAKTRQGVLTSFIRGKFN